MNALSGKAALDAYYLEARSKILDLAAILDRIDRGGAVSDDSRLKLIEQALTVLQNPGPGRAEKIQQVFSLSYDPTWEKPTPRF